jgi:hypothetical protein
MVASTIRRLITYVRTHAFMGECQMLQARLQTPTRISVMRSVIHVMAVSAALVCLA